MAFTSAHHRHARTHHGVFSLADLRRLGTTDEEIRHARRTGLLLRPVRSVFVLQGAPSTWEQSVAVACAAHPLAVASHRAAARLTGLRRAGGGDLVDITVPAGANGLLVGVVVHRSKLLPPDHVVQRPDGIRHTSVLRTVFDLASVVDDGAVESIIEQVIDNGWGDVASLAALGRQLRARGRGGSARFARVLASRPAWRRPAESDLEVRLDRALRALGLPPAERRAEVRLLDGTVIHPDLWWPALQFAVEVDHVRWHGGRADAQEDKRRDRQLLRLGVQVVRVTDEDVVQRLASVAHEIAAITERRRAA